mgnify:CR=1 FL=1
MTVKALDYSINILRTFNFDFVVQKTDTFWYVKCRKGGIIMTVDLVFDLIYRPEAYKLSQSNYDWLVANGDRLLAAIIAARLRR